MFRHAALRVAAVTSLLQSTYVWSHRLSVSWRSMSSLLDSIFTYTQTPRQLVSDRTGAAPVTLPGGPEIPSKQQMGETGLGVSVTDYLNDLWFCGPVIPRKKPWLRCSCDSIATGWNSWEGDSWVYLEHFLSAACSATAPAVWLPRSSRKQLPWLRLWHATLKVVHRVME